MTKALNAPDHHAVNALIATLFIGAIPHFIYQPFWVGLMFVMMIGWRLLHSYRGWPLPTANRWLKLMYNSTAILTVILLIGQFGLTIGRDAGVALLTIMLAFKIVEIRSLRDYYLSCYLGYFLIITNFFYSQSMLMLALMLIVIIMLTSCLIGANSSSAVMGLKKRLRLAGKMVLQAIPVMLILFVLFPRISGPIWGVPDDANSTSSTGISETLKMGEFSQLSLSDEIAFRVEFNDDTIPPSSALYWRGPVLWTTDGETWSALDRHQIKSQTPDITAQGQAVEYSITLEPHYKRWLFALDFPVKRPESINSFLTTDGRLLSAKPVKQRRQYQLQSNPSYLFNADNDPNLKSALQLPEGKHPRTLALAQQWQQQSQTDQQYIDRVLSHFNQQDFTYTLSPPALNGDTVDQFLFDSRQGFCEHYAASFTILMRAAGIPARIVTGYLGGDQNPVDDILIVRQRDAHAWSEVWLKGQGWVRIDPTSAVSSERIERGMADILPAERKSPVFIARSDALVKLWQQAKNNWDALNSAWDMWIVAFGPERQKQLLSLLGMQNPNWQKMAVSLAILLAIVGLIMLILSYYRREHAEPAVRLYQLYCRKLAQQGMDKKAHEGPYDFAERVTQQLPQYQQQIQSITALYSQLRYRQHDAAMLADLKQQVMRFRPKH